MSATGSLQVQDGTQIFYSVTGRGPWLILSNSLATDHGMWGPQLADLQARFTVLRYDTRGHGQSGISDDEFGFDALAADVVALIDHLGVDRAAFMGLSMGGMTGLALSLAHPGRIERVVCCDARADAPKGYKAMWDDNIALSESGGMNAVADRTMPRWFSSAFLADPENASQLASIRKMILRTPPEGYRKAARCLQTLDLLPSLDQITLPVHFIVGELDPAAPLPVVQDMAARVAGAQIQVIPGAAHLSNLENPDAFLAAALAQLT